MQQTLLNGRYEIEQKVGEGGMATVYRGRDLRLNRRVAIKILHSHYAHDADFLNRFQHEAQAAALLNHPNVVNVYDVGQDENLHYIVMEFVEGSNLKTLINREGVLPIDQAVAIAEAVALGLDAAHRFGLVHRDIKPQNIMVAPDQQVRITDFGIAKSHLSTALTQTGMTFGTADYISPEQAQGQPATPQSDLYSLGVTLYEMLTGHLPFSGDSPLAVAMQHVNYDPPSPRQWNQRIPILLESLVLQTLAKDPARRPGSAREFAGQLHTYRNAAEQMTISAPSPLRAPGQNYPRPTTAPLGNGNASGRTTIPPPRPLTTRAPQQQGASCGAFVVGMFVLVGVIGLVLFLSTGALEGDKASGLSQTPTRSIEVPVSTDTPDTPLPTLPPIEHTPTDTPPPSATDTPEPASPTPEPSPTTPPLPTDTPIPLPQIEVPLLLEQSADDAIAELQEKGLVPVRDERHSDRSAGQVIEQSPEAGTLVYPGRQVIYIVSLGPELITVPDVFGKRREDAEGIAASAGFQVEVIPEPHQTMDVGLVIRQEPSANEQITPSTPLRLFVSLGDVVPFPNVIGLERAEAEAQVRQAGFNLAGVHVQGRDHLKEQFDTFLPNRVISAVANDIPVQNGEFIPRGSNIVLGVRDPNG